MCFAPQRRALFRHLNFQKWSGPGVFCTFWLGNVLRATTACTFSTSQLPKVVREWCVFVHFDFEMCFAPQRRALFRHLNFQKWSENGVFCTFWLRNVLRATTACTFSTLQLPKVLRRWGVFVHFHLEICFTPQRRALFRHLNFQKWSENGVFCTFWLRNVLRATTACTFSTLQLPKVVRTPSVFVHFDFEMCFAPQRRALFRHLNFQKQSDAEVFCTFWIGNVLRATTACNFFISHLASWLRTRRFSEPTFRPAGATNHWKNTVFRDFPTFLGICIFFLFTVSLLLFFLLIFLFSLPLPCSAFHLSILSEVWLLNFLQ